MNGIKNFLTFINENWTTIIIICGLALSIYVKASSWLKLSKQEKIDFAKNAIKELMLKYVTKAEIDYSNWKKSGALKRCQVIEQIFKDYPILEQVTDREELIQWIDETIDKSLNDMKSLFQK